MTKRNLIFLLIAAMAVALIAPAFADAGRGGGGGGSRSGGSRSSGSSKSSGKGYGSKSSSSSKSRPTASKPSSGKIQQPAPVTKLIPPSPPPRVTSRTSTSPSGSVLRIPAGRSYSRDRDYIIRNPSYADPYGRSYYGSYYGGGGGGSNPFFYLWLFSIMDNDRSNNPKPPEIDGEVSPALLSYLQVIEAMAEAKS